MFVSLFLVIVGVCCCGTGNSQSLLGRPQLYGPSEALVNQTVEFECNLVDHPNDEPVQLQLFKEGNRTKLLGESTFMDGKVGKIPLKIKPYHDGNLECVATLQKKNNFTEATVSNTHYLKVVDPVIGAKVIVSDGVESFEGKTLELLCKLTAGNYVTYKWLLNNQPITHSHHHIQSDNHLWIYRTTSKDSGSYSCVATNQFNNTVYTSNAPEVVITVKDLVSDPYISFIVLKEDSHNYSATVTCESARGTLPITFSLYKREKLISNMTSDNREAVFKVPVVLGQHMGWLRCSADNGDRIAYSQWLPLEVVPVNGPVNIHYDYDTGENYAVVGLRFYCDVAKGSHPQYKWFLNNTLLHGRQSFYYVVNQPAQSILLLSVGRRSTGTYHCEASDSFDNTTSISSKKQYLDKEVLNRLPVLVVAVVFGCFTVLILLVPTCCWIGVIYRRRQFGENSLLSPEMKKSVMAYEGELELLGSSEDDDLEKTNTGDEFDQASEASVDEWLQIIEEKETLEDGPIEFP